MSTTYPTSKKNLTNPTSSQTLQNGGHAQLHADTNDTLEALQDTVGYTGDTTGTIIGRLYVAETKLAGIEASADVTDAANVGSAIAGASAKATPVDADSLALIDSAAANAVKKLSWTNLKATLKTYFDTLYAAVSHTHDDRYYTESETDTLLASKLESVDIADINATGTPGGTTFLRGDGVWSVPAGGGGGGGAVDSVNGQIGTVILDADDIDDTSTTNKFTTQAEIDKLAGITPGADVTEAGNVGQAIDGSTAKATPVDADTVAIINSIGSVLAKVTWANIKATLKTYFDTLYAGGAASSSDNALPRFDGTSGKTLQASAVIVSDTDDMTVPGSLTVNNGILVGSLADIKTNTIVERGAGAGVTIEGILNRDGSMTLPSTGSITVGASGAVITDNIAEKTAGNGVGIDGVILKDGGLNGVPIVTTTNVQTLTNKTIDGNSNTITNAAKYKIGTLSITATGSKVVTGVGFKPKMLRISLLPSTNGLLANFASGASDGTSQCSSSGSSYPGGGQAQVTSSTTKIIYQINHVGGLVCEASLTSFDTDGFTLNVTAESDQNYMYEAYG